jgi:hypothetical protein
MREPDFNATAARGLPFFFILAGQGPSPSAKRFPVEHAFLAIEAPAVKDSIKRPRARSSCCRSDRTTHPSEVESARPTMIAVVVDKIENAAGRIRSRYC